MIVEPRSEYGEAPAHDCSGGNTVLNRPQTRLRKLLGKLLLIGFGFLFGSLVAEGALRLIGYSYPEFYQPDQSRGYALRPNMEGWYRKEGEAYIKINGGGLRDVEHSKEKPANTIRIAIIGDSYPEALPVRLEDTFWSVMGKKLEQDGAFGGKKIEVINFGVSGYGTAQELITLREQVWNYSPDIVLLAVTTNNDVSDNWRPLKKTNAVPYFVYRDGKLILDDSFRHTSTFRWGQSNVTWLGRWINDHSRVIQGIQQGLLGLKIWLASKKAGNVNGNSLQHNQTSTSSEELGVDNIVYREPSGDDWNSAWDITEGLIVQMRNEVTANHARFVVVTLSNGIQVYPEAWVRQSFMKRVGVNDLFYPDNRIKALAEREKIPVVTLAPQMQAYAEQKKVFLHGFGSNIGNGHWNQLGHRVAGEALAQKFREGLLN